MGAMWGGLKRRGVRGSHELRTSLMAINLYFNELHKQSTKPESSKRT